MRSQFLPSDQVDFIKRAGASAPEVNTYTFPELSGQGEIGGLSLSILLPLSLFLSLSILGGEGV